MDQTTYDRILKSIENKAPLESGVQALVYMLVFEILEDKELKKKKLDVVIIDNMQSHSVFMSYDGISDLAIVKNIDEKGFNYNSSERTEIDMCIEVKARRENIDSSKNKKRVKRQLLTYKKAIITNGKEWDFYKLPENFYVPNESINEVIENERNLAKMKKHRNKSEEDKQTIETLEEKINKEREDIDREIEYESIQPETVTIEKPADFEILCTKLKNFIAGTPVENVNQ